MAATCLHMGWYLSLSQRYFSSVRTFKSCFDNCKASFYCSFNIIYGSLGCASPEVIVHILSSQCMTVLLYGLDFCPIKDTNLRSRASSNYGFYEKCQY